ncbi:MAG: sulfatase-like hydrolase/transferase, partial [Gemmatimonadales bacterium]
MKAIRSRVALAILGALVYGCGNVSGGRATLGAGQTSLHLHDHLADAAVEASPVPAEDREKIEWTFEAGADAWQAVPANVAVGRTNLDRRNGVLGVVIGPQNIWRGGALTRALVYAPVPDLDRADWGALVVRARVRGNVQIIHPFYNVRANAPPGDPLRLRADSVGRTMPFWATVPTLNHSPGVTLSRDSAVHTYRLPIPLTTPGPRDPQWIGPIREIGLIVGSNNGAVSPAGQIDLHSVTLERRGAEFADSAIGSRDIDREGVLRPSLYTHAPSRLRWRVRVPGGANLGVALTTHDARSPVTFTVTVSSRSGDTTVFREVVNDATTWQERGIDLAAFAGQTVELALGTQSSRPGQIAFWGSPILSGAPSASANRSRPPNVIVFVIDGGGADLMSLYGYNRRTTPNLDHLSAEGVVFERAHSNAAWTKPSTASFMTGLQHSALGGFRGYGDQIPEAAPTMGQRFHDAGYQTAVFTFHANAGRGSALNRGVDRFQDNNGPGQPFVESARFLTAAFWGWRAAFPGSPYWAHFQVTDVHEPQITLPPF